MSDFTYPLVTIADIASDEKGSVAIGPFGSAMKADLYVAKGVPVIRGNNIGKGRSIVGEFVHVPEETATRLKRSLLKENDLFFPHRGAIGEVGIIGQEAPAKSVMSSSLMRLRVKEDIADPEFVFWFFKSALGRHEILLYASTVGTPGIGTPLASLRSMRLPLPPLKTQREVTKILGALDDKIELNRRMSATLEEMARALYRSWFVDFDPVHARALGQPPAHMDPTTAALFPESFASDGLPKGWTHEPIIDQAVWVNGAAYKNMHFSSDPAALPVVKIAELKAGITAGTKFTATDLGERYRIGNGELLFSWSGNPDTSIDAFVWTHGDAWLNQHIFAVRQNGRMPKSILFSMLRFFKPEMAEIARNKQTTGLGHITRKDLEAFPIAVATPEIIQAFEAILEPIYSRYFVCLSESNNLANLRDTLLPRLMSGELRIREAEQRVEEVV